MVTKRFTIGWFLRNIVLWFVVFIMILPFFHMIAVSLSGVTPVKNGEVFFWPKEFNTDVYKELFADPNIIVAYKNTVIYTIVGTAISLFVLTTGSYALSKKRCPFGKLINILIMITISFSGGLYPTHIIMKWLGLMNTVWNVVLPTALTPFSFLLMRSFFAQYPSEIEDAGRIDGLNDIGVLWRIVLPTSMAVIVTVGIFCAVGYWNLNDKTAILAALNDAFFPPHMMIIQKEMRFAEESIKCAAFVVSICPLIILAPFVQKYFMKGIKIGSIKG